jgi:hypothetical protein
VVGALKFLAHRLQMRVAKRDLCSVMIGIPRNATHII